MGPRFSRYTVASLIATGITQLVMWWLYASLGVPATAASAVGFVVGAVPHFVMIRWWAWGQRGVPKLTRQVVGYLVVTALGGLVSVLFTTLADWLIGPLVEGRGNEALVLGAAYVLGGLPVFIAKFALLDRLFAERPATGRPATERPATERPATGRPGPQPASDSASSTSVLAAKPVAPGTTSP